VVVFGLWLDAVGSLTHLPMGRSLVFYVLLNLLRDSECKASKYVLLEEQLAIFLYASVTGLSVRHLGEGFQHSNDTISKCIIPSLVLIN
jgi:hypothetical protein